MFQNPSTQNDEFGDDFGEFPSDDDNLDDGDEDDDNDDPDDADWLPSHPVIVEGQIPRKSPRKPQPRRLFD